MKFLVLSLAFLSACASHKVAPAAAPAPLAFPTTLEEAVDSDYRNPDNKLRDVARHPLATLQFFGMKPDMTVVEITPAAGWYSEILAPFLTAHGTYYAAVNAPNAKFDAFFAAHPELKVNRTQFNPPANVDIAPAGSADMVVTFRNIHNWASKGAEDAAFAAFFRALKKGGILGVEEHRANADSKKDPKFASGYMREIDVIKMAEKAGFRLAGHSEVNANPRDTKDYPSGVWTLPPVYRLGEKDRERFKGIGESDRMTLKFIKP